MSIQRLPGDVAVQIKSSTTVTSLNGTVLGLLKNALDAGARNVSVTVDSTRGGCTVEDDGLGIPPYEFSAEGGLGKRHYTSKYPSSPGLYGRHGLFLASAGALSLLMITSRCQGHDTWSSLAMHNGRLLRRHVSEASDAWSGTALLRGTRVVVRDLFGCMPVRARLRPQLASGAWTRDWDSLVRTTTALLIAYPRDVTITLKDVNSACRRTLRTDNSESGRDGIARTARLLVQAGYSDVADPASWVNIEACVPGASVTGCISLIPVSSRKTQFISIGIEPLSEDSVAGSLYGEINKIFAESDFGAAADGENATQKAATGTIDTFIREQRLRKAVDKWPMFSIGVTLEDDVEMDDVLNDQRQHLGIIKRLLRTMLCEFLAQHGFYQKSAALHGQRHSGNAPPAKKPKTAHASRQLPCRWKDSAPSVSLFSSWPQTKQSSRPQKKQTDDSPAPRSQLQMEKSMFFTDLCSHSDDIEEGGWMEEGSHGSTAMDSWDKNTLVHGKMKISRASLEAARVIGQVDQKFILIQAPVVREQQGDPERNEASEEESILILVDQHAADERCRVEALLQDYISASATPETVHAHTTVLAKPLTFELPAHELAALRRARGYFRHWGIYYDVVASGREDEGPLLRVDRLPVSIADRCAQEPRLVMDILRSEVSDKGASLSARSVPATSEAVSWVARLDQCPQTILDLVSSKACRSAIRFNDPLAREECVELLARLLACSFPFQCAHGRPSMVPVLNLV